jgi:hypothetical protein
MVGWWGSRPVLCQIDAVKRVISKGRLQLFWSIGGFALRELHLTIRGRGLICNLPGADAYHLKAADRLLLYAGTTHLHAALFATGLFQIISFKLNVKLVVQSSV